MVYLLGLWHSRDRRFLTLWDLHETGCGATAIYTDRDEAENDIRQRVSERDRPFIKIEVIS